MNISMLITLLYRLIFALVYDNLPAIHASSEIDEGPLSHEAEVACRMAKAKASETIQFAGDRSVQFHGGFGFTWECDSSLFIRRAAWSQQQFGDAMHHRKRLAPLLLDS